VETPNNTKIGKLKVPLCLMTEANPVSETLCVRNIKLMDNVQTFYLIEEHAIRNLNQCNKDFHCARAICKPPHLALATKQTVKIKRPIKKKS
jgi:hypothetical protein